MVKTRKVPMRMCAVTRERFEKKDLVRVVKTPTGEVVIDLTGKLNGRGVYLKKDLNIYLEAEKKDVFSRVFEQSVDKSIYEELKNLK